MLNNLIKGAILLLFLLLSSVEAQPVGQRYYWADSLNITTTSTDTTFTYEWESVTMWSDTVDTWVKIGAPDVGSWASRRWIFLPAGLTITIGPRPQLKRLGVKTKNGKGVFNLIGYKTRKQY